PDNADFCVTDIDKWHKEFGWDGCGYHKIITKSGRVENGRPDAKIGIHCSGQNSDSVGICLIGSNEFNKKQLTALRNLISDYKEKFPQATVHGHNEFSTKTCPNFNVKEWYENNVFIKN
ncbi:MAG: N-acetylmuramoyl-L-alanine amidase, partial [Rickettsiales bacterium]|nr:N-acetylmuramoyl-L-alanine amidase [Rickettsiales bacterium]